MIISTMLLSLVGALIAYLVVIKDTVLAYLRKFLLPKKPKSEIMYYGEEVRCQDGSVFRRYSDVFQAILNHIHQTNLDGVSHLEHMELKSHDTTMRTLGINYRTGKPYEVEEKKEPIYYLPNLSTPFELIPKSAIYCERDVVDSPSAPSEGGGTNKLVNAKEKVHSRKISLRIYSNVHTILELKVAIDGIVEKFQKFMTEDIDKNQYYFVTKLQKKVDENTGSMSEDKELAYQEMNFFSTRTFDNIFFEQKNELRNRLDFFLNNKEWYQERGVPYSLGFLFFGPPGTGKTSTIKAIANYTKRHIVEVSLSRIKTYEHLQGVFHNPKIGNKVIPRHKLIYLLEDIDCLDEIVIERGSKKVAGKAALEVEADEKDEKAKKDSKKDKEEKKKTDDDDEEKEEGAGDALLKLMGAALMGGMNKKPSKNDDPVTLSHLLNLLDGLLECHGRILIITSNHPDKLDRALIRPGRVDLKVNFDYCTRDDTCNILDLFYRKKVDPVVVPEIAHKKLTAAEVYQICFQNLDFETSLEHLKEKHEESEDSTSSLRTSTTLKNNYLSNSRSKKEFSKLKERAKVREFTGSGGQA